MKKGGGESCAGRRNHAERAEPVAGSTVAKMMASFVEDAFFVVGQRIEPVEADFIQNTIDLGVERSA